MFYVTTQNFWSSNKYDVMLTENATSVQYFKSLLSRKQKSVVSESTFAIKKKKRNCGHSSHSYSVWSFVTVLSPFLTGRMFVCPKILQTLQ